MPSPRDPALLAKAARLYFVDDRSQDDVATILGTTRSNVSRMLKQARDLGIVEIRILDPAGRDQELELALRDRFGLADARVLEPATETDVLSGVGRLAARWLEETVRDGQVVALSWGHSLQAMVRAVDGLSRRDVQVVQLVGGLSALDSALTGQELVRELSERIGARHRYLHAPAL
ncbi:MAG TPA: sugar-binding domain-containing protein, partial [Actinomycetota bacterium]|nr:sugar-binding domain-containing protein [Actinomycetota bacterium]